MTTARRPTVTVFSTFHKVESTLRKRHPDIPLKIVNVESEENGLPIMPLSQEEYQVLAEAEILLTEPPSAAEILYKLPKLKWMHSVWAGIEEIFCQLDSAKPLPEFTLTTFCGSAKCARMREYVIGHIIAHERSFAKYREDQSRAVWEKSTSPIFKYRSLTNLSIGILGIGKIGQEVAMVCKALGMTVWGLVQRDLPPDTRSPHVDQYRKTEQLAELLENCDYVCNVLPSTKATAGLLNGTVLQSCQTKESVFINIGRGDIINEKSLLNALRQGWIAAAILDVFEKEPLPKESQLWTMQKVTITPHVSSYMTADELVEGFAENYKRYVNGEDLTRVVSWERGY